jgi:hypothetical protein
LVHYWKTTTLIAALDRGGIRCSTVVDGAVNADVFEAFVEQVLLPTLRGGDVVVMDNLSSHKNSWMSRVVRQAFHGASVRPTGTIGRTVRTGHSIVTQPVPSRLGRCTTNGVRWLDTTAALLHLPPIPKLNAGAMIRSQGVL